jgi:hypothetical protein
MTVRRTGRLFGLWVLILLVVPTACTSGSADSSRGSPPASTPRVAGVCRLQTDTGGGGKRANQLRAVAGTGSTDYWAVGTAFVALRPEPLVQHWNGSTWQTQLPAGRRFDRLELYDVAALGRDDVWAVGSSDDRASSIHWNGTSWTEIPGAAGHPDAAFLGLAAVSPDDLWVAGKEPGPDDYDRPLVERSDGSSWTTVPVRMPDAIAAGLRSVSASGPASIWAVGWSVGYDQRFRPLIERWDGSRWSIEPVPRLQDDTVLSGVAVQGRNDVWAVGWSWRGDAASGLVLHWDGTTWTDVTLPASSAVAAGRLATVTVSGEHVGIAGQAPAPNGILQPLASILTGATWTDHGTPVEPFGGGFQGMMLLGHGGIVAVGNQISPDGYGSLVQKGC